MWQLQLQLGQLDVAATAVQLDVAVTATAVQLDVAVTAVQLDVAVIGKSVVQSDATDCSAKQPNRTF